MKGQNKEEGKKSYSETFISVFKIYIIMSDSKLCDGTNQLVFVMIVTK